MIQDLPINERPREKLLQFGSKSLSNSELIAVLLSSGSHDESAISLATKILLLENGSLNKLSNYEPEEFMLLKGVGVAKACTLVAAMELGRRIATTPTQDKILVNSPDVLAKLFMEDMRYLNKEVVRVALLDVRGRLISRVDVSIGSISEAAAHPREVFAPAIKKGASAIIIAHNHPSGDCTPSDGDIASTRQIVGSGRILGIKVLDHLIIGEGCFCSLYDKNHDLFK